MSISQYIQSEVILPRLRKNDILVVYDPVQRYRDLTLALAEEKRTVIDATASSIESREQAMVTLQALGQANPSIDGMIVYVPAHAPMTDEEKQSDPFALYGEIGAVFPNPHDDGDEYQSICLKAMPEHATEIRRIFAETDSPDFAVIDAVGGPGGWPILQAALKEESTRNILTALMAPSAKQKAGLKDHDGWATEAKTLFKNALELKLLTRSTKWKPVADELWRFVLFSEFVFDLPVELPGELADVPYAHEAARPIIEELCDGLRNDRRTENLYIERAEEIERLLELPQRCEAIPDLGERDTFPFEERSYFAAAVIALRENNLDRVRQILDSHTDSVWTGRDQSQLLWRLLRAAVDLYQSCADAEALLPDHTRTQDALLAFYVTHLQNVDRLQREFEQLATNDLDTASILSEVIDQARTSYRRLIDNVQAHFVRHLELEGWPPPGYLANADLFDTLVAPHLQESGQRIALFLIDALRYELGVELHRNLAEDHEVTMQPVCAQMPTVTPVGMASLLPGAGLGLTITRHNNKPVPTLQGEPLSNVTARMAILRDRYGQRFAEYSLSDFVRGAADLPETTELLVLRSNEMDNDFESNPEAALSNIGRTLKQIHRAVHQLQEMGCRQAIIATDHGFYYNSAIEAGDACSPPPGSWTKVHERMLLGDGSTDASHYRLSADRLGIRGDYNQVAGPRAMVAYRAGQTYFHGGASLQEAIVPVISLRLQTEQVETFSRPDVALSYKRGAKRITTRRPVLEIAVGAGDLLSQDTALEIQLEAQENDGNVVGELRPGGPVNPATLTLTLNPNDVVKVTLIMDDEFEGKFTVKALDPTTLTTYDKLDLRTDYTV